MSTVPEAQQLAQHEYTDVSSSIRHYGNMQFAQMTIFFAVNAGLFWNVTGATEKPSSATAVALKVIAILLSVLFLCMGRRVTDYWDKLVARAIELESTLGYGQYGRRPKRRVVNNRLAVYLVYYTVAVLWTIMLIWPLVAHGVSRLHPSEDTAIFQSVPEATAVGLIRGLPRVVEIAMVGLGLVAVVSAVFSIVYLATRWRCMQLPDKTGMASIIISCVVIPLMLLTIWTGNKSLQESTARTVGAISAQVSQINSLEKQRRVVGLLALRKELEFNSRTIDDIVGRKNEFMDGSHVPVEFFEVAAYAQGTVTECIGDEALVDRIIACYQDLRRANAYIRLLMDTSLTALAARDKLLKRLGRNLLGICDRNKSPCIDIGVELQILEDAARKEIARSGGE